MHASFSIMGRPPSAGGAPAKCIGQPPNTGGVADLHSRSRGSLISYLREQHAQAELLVEGLQRHFEQSARRLEQLHQVEHFGTLLVPRASASVPCSRPSTPGPLPGTLTLAPAPAGSLAEGGSSSSCAPFTAVVPIGQGVDGAAQAVPPQGPHPAQRPKPSPPRPERHQQEPPLHSAWGPLPELPGQQPEEDEELPQLHGAAEAAASFDGNETGADSVNTTAAMAEELADLDGGFSSIWGQRTSTTNSLMKKPFLDQFVHSTAFNLFCSCVTLLNAVFVGRSAEYRVMYSVAALESHHNSHARTTLDETVKTVDSIFCLWFAIELFLNISAGPREFVSAENWKWSTFDVFLVMFCVVEFFLADGLLPSLNNFRTLRVFRALRVLRVVKVFKVFRSLRLMVLAIAQSLIALMWVFVLLFLLIYIFSMIFLDAAEQYISVSDSADPNAWQLVEYYGSVPKACYTLFIAISGGMDWDDVVAPLLAVSPWYRVVFSGYIFFTTFGVLNVVTGAFVDSFAVVSARDREVVIEDEMKREKRYLKDIQAIFDGADADGSGTLSIEEFETHLKDERVKSFFSSLELDVKQARTLFKLLDADGSNEVGIEEFVHGCLRLKGGAKSVDVHMLLLQSERMMDQVDSLEEHTKASLSLLIAERARGSLRARPSSAKLPGTMNSRPSSAATGRCSPQSLLE